MSGHLARMVVRSTRPAEGGLRRRLPSMFEQPSFDPGPARVHTAEENIRLPVPERSPRTTSPRGDVEVPVVREESELPAVGKSPEVGAAPDDFTPHQTQARTGGARTRRKRPPETVPAQPVRHESESPRRVAARSEPPLPEAEPSTPARPAVREQVEGLPTADRSSAGPRETPVVDRRANVPPGSPEPLPRADVPPVVPVRQERPRGDPSNPNLPRLQPTSRTGQRSARPEVTVNIGRIEVIPPTPEPRKTPPERRPQAPLRAPGAPKLADYLRERKSR
jgi:hypothetical protein